MTKETFRPVLRTQADVEKFWTEICHPLGWRTPELWVVLVDSNGEPFPSVQQVAELPEKPDEVAVGNLVMICRDLLGEFAPGGRVATLLCRPGTGFPTVFDKAWARALRDASRREGVELEVVHVATDVAITPLPMDAAA